MIIAGAYYVISDKLLNYDNFNQLLWSERIESLGSLGFSFVLFLLFLSLVNWTLEILKWQSLVEMIEQISFKTSTKQSLASLTASLMTPNRIGEYGAKAVYFNKNQRPKVLLLNFLGNAYQMLITVLLGLIGIVVLKDFIVLLPIQFSTIIVIAIIISLVLICLAFVYKKWTASIHLYLFVLLLSIKNGQHLYRN